MKLTSLSVVFVIIISPFLFISARQSELAREDAKLRNYYDTLIDNAVQDAALILSQNIGDPAYSKNVDISDAKALAAESFFDSLQSSFHVQGSVSSMVRVESCVPVLIFLETDGFSLFALHSFKNQEDRTEICHCWFPKQHYVGAELIDRYSVRYTLTDRIYIFDKLEKALYEGDYENFKDRISFFDDPRQFEDLQLTAVKNTVEEAFKSYMGRYNEWAFGRSLSVSLEFPAIADADWKRALTDEGILVFAQGFPVLQGKSYTHYALGGARVIRKAPLKGYIFQNQPYYCRTDCDYFNSEILNDAGFDADTVVYFSNACEAAKNGYRPCPYCRP